MASAVATKSPMLVPNRLYVGEDGRCFCGTLACAGMTAFFTGLALDGHPVISLQTIAIVEPLDMSEFACEGCGRKVCPSCAGMMTKEHGTVSEVVIGTGVNVKKRVARPATFYACGSCEHCEEVGRG